MCDESRLKELEDEVEWLREENERLTAENARGGSVDDLAGKIAERLMGAQVMATPMPMQPILNTAPVYPWTVGTSTTTSYPVNSSPRYGNYGTYTIQSDTAVTATATGLSLTRNAVAKRVKEFWDKEFNRGDGDAEKTGA